MSIEALAVALHHSKSHGTALLVLLGICNHHGDGGAFPAVETLAKYARAEPRNVFKALKTLVDLGEIRVDPRPGKSSVYRVLIGCPESCDRSFNHRDRRATPDGSVRGLSTSPDGSVTPTPDATVRGPLTVASGEPYFNRQGNLPSVSVSIAATVAEHLRKIAPPREYLLALGLTTRPAGLDMDVVVDKFLARNDGRWNLITDIDSAWRAWVVACAIGARPGRTSTPSTPKCPRHPARLTGSRLCPDCVAESVPPPPRAGRVPRRRLTPKDPT